MESWLSLDAFVRRSTLINDEQKKFILQVTSTYISKTVVST